MKHTHTDLLNCLFAYVFNIWKKIATFLVVATIAETSANEAVVDVEEREKEYQIEAVKSFFIGSEYSGRLDEY